MYINLMDNGHKYLIYLLTQTEIFTLPHILGIQLKNVPHLQLYVDGRFSIIFVLLVHNYLYCYTLLFLIYVHSSAKIF